MKKFYIMSIIGLLILILCFGGVIIYNKFLNDNSKEERVPSREQMEVREYLKSILATDTMCNKKPIYSFNDINDADMKWLTEVAYVGASKKQTAYGVVTFDEIDKEAKILFGNDFKDIDKAKVGTLNKYPGEYYFVCDNYPDDNIEVDYSNCYHPGHGKNGVFVNFIDNIEKANDQYIVTLYTHDGTFTYFEITRASLYFGIEEGTILDYDNEVCKNAIGKRNSWVDLKCKGIYAFNGSEKKEDGSPQIYYYGTQKDLENYVIGNDKDFDKMKLTIVRNEKGNLNIISSEKVN